MKILVDANILTRKQKTGVDYYTRNLIFATARAMPEHSFVLGYYGKGVIKIPKDINNIRLKRIWWLPSKMYGLHRHYLRFLPLELFMPVRADAMLFTDYGCPVTIQNVPKLAVVHDLTYKVHPQYVLAGHATFLDQLVRQALQQATQIIAVSESTKRDLATQYRYNEKNVSVVHPGVDAHVYQPTSQKEVTAVGAKYDIQENYILFLSTLEPRKNVTGIIQAYSQLPDSLREKYQLVLAGKKGWLDEEIEQLCQQMGDRVLRVGRVDTVDKPALYTGASAFMYPSAYEGFGIPILEAMGCGTPVITSSVSSMPEVAGDAALMVNPDNVQEITTVLSSVLTDTKLAQKLRQLGIKRITEFTWQKSGQELATLLRNLPKT